MAVTGRLGRTPAWGDCDPAGIIDDPTCYRWMDAATWALVGDQAGPGSALRSVSIPGEVRSALGAPAA